MKAPTPIAWQLAPSKGRMGRWTLMHYSVDYDRTTLCGRKVPTCGELFNSSHDPNGDHCLTCNRKARAIRENISAAAKVGA